MEKTGRIQAEGLTIQPTSLSTKSSTIKTLRYTKLYLDKRASTPEGATYIL